MHYREKEIRLASADENRPGREYSSMASKPINIRWTRMVLGRNGKSCLVSYYRNVLRIIK